MPLFIDEGNIRQIYKKKMITTEEKQENHHNTRVIIVGGGITGLSLAAVLAEREIPFVLLEKKKRLGGQIHTICDKGYTYELGPNTGSISTPEVIELFNFVAPEAVLEVASNDAKRRLIWKGRSFHALPSGLWSGITTPLFTFSDKLRLLGEPFRKRGTDPLESVGSLAERRMGKSFVDYAVDPFIGGIYAGNPYRIVTQYALPKLYRLEQDYGSFIGGALRKALNRQAKDPRVTKEVFSAEGGLSRLIEALESKLKTKGSIITGAEIVHSDYAPSTGWSVTYTDKHEEKHTVAADHYITTVRSDLLHSVLPNEIAPLLAPIEQLRYAPITEVIIGFDHLPEMRTKAFGGLVPSCENCSILGILFTAEMFRNRVPYEDSFLFNIFMGGDEKSLNPDEYSDEELLCIAERELRRMLSIPANRNASLQHIARYRKAIPQYDETSPARLERIREIEQAYPGLVLAGGIRDGIGLAARIAQGVSIGKEIATHIK